MFYVLLVCFVCFGFVVAWWLGLIVAICKRLLFVGFAISWLFAYLACYALVWFACVLFAC